MRILPHLSFATDSPVSPRQRDMLLWAFDDNGWVDVETFLVICKHEGIDWDGIEDDAKYELLRSLGWTAYLRTH